MWKELRVDYTVGNADSELALPKERSPSITIADEQKDIRTYCRSTACQF